MPKNKKKKLSIFDIIGWIGLIFLVLAPIFDGLIMRIIWIISSIFLVTYTISRKDLVMTLVNASVVVTNIFFIVFN